MSLECENCENNCFNDSDDSCVSISFSNEAMGIEEGVDSLKTALIKISNEVQCLKEDTCDPCNKCKDSISSSTSSSGTFFEKINSSSGPSLGTVPITLSVVPGKSNTVISYNVDSALKEFKSNSKILKVEFYGRANGIFGRLNLQNSTSGSFTASPENFPVTLVIDSTVISEGGQKVLNFKKEFLNNKYEDKGYFTVLNTSAESVSSQSEFNSHVNNQMDSISNRVDKLESISVNGKTGLNSVFVDIQLKINDLSLRIDEVEKSNSEEITDLKSEITSLTSTINTQASQISQLQQQYETLARLIS